MAARRRRSEPAAETPEGAGRKRRRSGEQDARRTGKGKRRTSAEQEATRPKSGEKRRASGARDARPRSRTAQARGRRPRSGEAGAVKKPLPPWLIPVVAGCGLLILISVGMALMGGGDGKPDGDSVAKTGGSNSAGGSSGAEVGPGGMPKGLDGEQQELWEELKISLDTTEEEIDLNPPLSRKAAQEILAVAQDAGFKGLAARASKIEQKITEALERYYEAEYTERKAEIDSYLAKIPDNPLAILDALQLLDSTLGYFEGRASPAIKAKLDALARTVRGSLDKAIDTQLAAAEDHLENARWNEARDSIDGLQDYGDKGEELREKWERKLEERKQQYFRERLAKIRAERREQGVKRFEAAVAAIGKRRELEARLLAARTERARAATGRRPIPVVSLSDSTTFIKARVEKVGAAQITLAGKHRGRDVTRAIDWNLLEPRSRIELTRLMLTDDDAPGYVELGKYCIVQEKFDEAQAAFDKAVAIDAALKGKLPNVDEFREAPTYSSGKEDWKADRLRIEFDFADAAQLADFGGPTEGWLEHDEEGGQMKARVRTMHSLGGGYDLRAPLQYELVPGDLPPGGYMVIQVDWNDTSKGASRRDTGVAVVIGEDGKKYATMDGSGAGFMVMLLGKRFIDRLDFKDVKKPDVGKPIGVLADKDKIGVLLGETSLFDATGEISGASMMLTGFSRNRTAMMGVKQLVFEGRLSKRKFKRVVAEKKARRVRKLHTRLDAEAVSSEYELPEIPTEHIEQLNAGDHLRWRMIVQNFRDFLKGEVSPEIVEKRFEEFQNRNDKCAAFFFYRAYFNYYLSRFFEAERDFDKAIELDTEFAEPRVYKANLLYWMGKELDSRACLAEALEIRPDHGFGRALQARLLFYQGGEKRQAALEKMEIAKELSPGDTEIATELEQLKTVLKGPPWPEGKPQPIESEHFIVHTDLPAARGKEFLTVLERIRKEYQKLFPMGDVKDDRKGICFIFATKATYSIYFELSLGGGGADNTLGYYHPGFKDIHLFDNAADADRKPGERLETLDTLHHEAWHQYIDRLIPSIPRWINEGMAEYYGAMTWKEDGTVIHNLQRERLRWLARWKKDGDCMKLRDLMTSNAAEFMRYPVGYGHAWSVAHLCLVHKPDQYKAALMGYLNAVRANKSPEVAYQETFGKLDLDAMERDWSTMVDQMVAKIAKEDGE